MLSRVSRRPLTRLWQCFYKQQAKMRHCPPTPRLDGKTALVTGATSGIGRETARGLLERGAHVIMACRNIEKAVALKAEFVASGFAASAITLVQCDLSDLQSVRAAIDEIAHLPHSQPINLLVENAGIMAADYAVSPQGHEISFATNVLGHFALRRGILEQDLRAHNARVIIVTGDIYVLSKNCTADYVWRGRLGGLQAYCRSKLGNFWIGRELQRRYPSLSVFMVHPGVVATNLGRGGDDTDNGRTRLWDGFAVTAEMGAQTLLACASQPDMCHGSYYHNVHGEAELANDDPAMNDIAACALWERCLQLSGTIMRSNIHQLKKAS
jgi:NAD(P)-dependent dehydrogenase (short-subunit alcohol dehydrogenase family)